MEKKRWYHYIPVYILWILLAVLGAWIAIVARETTLGLLGTFYVGNSTVLGWRARFYDKVYVLAAGLAWLVVTVVTEEIFRAAVERNALLRRFASFAWPELALLFVADLTLFLLQGGYGWFRWLIIVAEVLLGVGFWFIARVHTKKPSAAKVEE